MENPREYYALPPRGITVSTIRIGMYDKREHYTFFCDANPNCYALAYGLSEETVRKTLANHICPAEPRRDLHASGHTAIQKAWDELDEVIIEIKKKTEKGDDDSETHILQGKALGLATAIAFFAPQYFRDRDNVLREAQRRWKMGTGQIPREPTPGYNLYPVAPSEYLRREDVAQPAQSRVAPAKRAASQKQATKESVKVTRNFTLDELRLIRQTVAANTMPIEDVAKMWAVSVDRIRVICTPVDESVNNLGLPIAMF